jgi:hypothetical protein
MDSSLQQLLLVVALVCRGWPPRALGYFPAGCFSQRAGPLLPDVPPPPPLTAHFFFPLLVVVVMVP